MVGLLGEDFGKYSGAGSGIIDIYARVYGDSRVFYGFYNYKKPYFPFK